MCADLAVKKPVKKPVEKPDKKSGKNAERGELWAALTTCAPGVTLIVPALNRLGRAIQDLISIGGGLPTGPTTDGSCLHVQPEVATKMTAARSFDIEGEHRMAMGTLRSCP